MNLPLPFSLSSDWMTSPFLLYSIRRRTTDEDKERERRNKERRILLILTPRYPLSLLLPPLASHYISLTVSFFGSTLHFLSLWLGVIFEKTACSSSFPFSLDYPLISPSFLPFLSFSLTVRSSHNSLPRIPPNDRKLETSALFFRFSDNIRSVGIILSRFLSIF